MPDIRLVLASASPRRRELLERLGVPFEVRPADLDEQPRSGEDPVDLVRRLAAEKAEAALAAAVAEAVVVVAADTVVVLDKEVLGKPVDGLDAERMLRRLAGRTHRVLTGVAVAWRSEAPDPPDARACGGASDTKAGEAAPEGVTRGSAAGIEVDVEATEVTMTAMADADVAWYVGTGEPLDKAGAYGIQGRGALFVSSIRGGHDNVVGLPLALTRRLLVAAGHDPLAPARSSAGVERR